MNAFDDALGDGAEVVSGHVLASVRHKWHTPCKGSARLDGAYGGPGGGPGEAPLKMQ